MNIGQKASQGFFATLSRNLLAKVMGMIAMIFLARRLTPYDFGVVSLTEVVLNIVAVAGVTGIGEFLLAYRGEDEDEMVRAVFWFNLVLSLAVVLVLILVGPWWAEHNGDLRIRNLTWLVAGTFLVHQLQVVPKAMLARRLDFKTQVRLQNPFVVIISLGKIAAVFAGMGVYSLVVPSLVFGAIQTVLFFWKVPMGIGFDMHVRRWADIFRFSRHLAGQAVLSRLTDEGDKVIVARFVSVASLGLYNLAWQLANLITSNVVLLTNTIVSAVLPKYRDDIPLMQSHYFQFLKGLALACFPILCAMGLLAEPTVRLLYGPRWVGAVAPFQILLVYALVRTVTSSFGSVTNSLQRPDLMFYINLAYTPCHLAATLLGSWLGGIAGLAAALVAVKLIFIAVTIRRVVPLLLATPASYYANLAPITLLTAAVTALMAPFYLYVASVTSSAAMTIIAVSAVFAVVFVIAARIFLRRDIALVGATLKRANDRVFSAFRIVFGSGVPTTAAGTV